MAIAKVRRSAHALAVLAGIGLSFLAPFAAARPAFAALNKGDVLAAVGNGMVNRFDSNGNLLGTLDTKTGSTYTAGMCVDAGGDLFVTDFTLGEISKFDPSGALLASKWASYPGVELESCIPDGSDNLYVGGPSSPTLYEYNPGGTLTGTFPTVPDLTGGTLGTDWVDLAENQCTVLYTGEGTTIKQYDVCKSAQLSDFAIGLPGPCYEVRIRPDHQVVVACQGEVDRLSASGALLQKYTILGTTQLFSLALDPDDSTFWTGDQGDGTIYHVDFTSGTVLGHFNSQPNTQLAGLYVVGEIVVSQSKLDLTPPIQTQKATVTNATLVANLHVGTAPLAGKSILFSVSGANSLSKTVMTDAGGDAILSYPGTNIAGGTDVVTACYDSDNSGTCDAEEQTATATVSWIAEQIIVRATAVFATEGQPFTGVAVATLSDPDTASTASEYSATIAWGDGATSAGTISGGGGSFIVQGSHTYAEEGTYTTTVTVVDVDDTANTASDSNKATVGDAILAPAGITPAGNSSEAYTVAASFIDINPLATAADFTATIDWGDGTTSPGTVNGSGSFYTASGSHFYKVTTGYFVKVHVADDGGSTVDQTTVVQVLGSPCAMKSLWRWHDSANGGNWSGSLSPDCTTGVVKFTPGSVSDAVAGPGTTVTVGYDFSLPGNKSTVTVVYGSPFAVFELTCLDGTNVTPFAAPLPSQAYAVNNGAWIPSANPNDPLTYQASFTVPDICGGGKVRLTKGTMIFRVSIF
jgi:hypothetical protein